MLEEKKGCIALGSENDNYFQIKFKSYNVNYFRTKGVQSLHARCIGQHTPFIQSIATSQKKN